MSLSTPVPANSGHTCRLDLPTTNPATALVPRIRHHTHAILTSWGLPEQTVDIADLVLDELVANAATHSTPLTVTLTLAPGGLRIEVDDSDPRPLAEPSGPTGAHATHGRGLHIVHTLATAHGCHSHPTHKTVWAHLAL